MYCVIQTNTQYVISISQKRMTTELMNNLRRQFLDKVNQCFSSDSEKHADAEQLLESQLSEDEVKLARVV